MCHPEKNSGACEVAAVQFEGSGGRAEEGVEICGAAPHLPKFDFIALPVLLLDVMMDPSAASVKQKLPYCFPFSFFIYFTTWGLLMLVKKIIPSICVKSQAPKPQCSYCCLGVQGGFPDEHRSLIIFFCFSNFSDN